MTRLAAKLESFDIALGRRLKEFRKAAGVTQGKAAERLGLSRPQYCNIELGRSGLLCAHLWKLADLYGVSTDTLLQRNDRDWMRV